jgi:hypothetical protein
LRRSIHNVEEEIVKCETNTTIDALTNPGLIFEVHDGARFFAEPYTPKEKF